MLGFLHSIFPSLKSGDEMKYLKPSPNLKAKKRERFEFESSPLLQKDGIDGEKVGTKLKILMRKEAASRLLSKCRDGGILDYEDVAHDLKTMPRSYARVLSCNAKYE